MAEHAHIIRVAKYRPQPGAAEDLRDALHALADGMRGLSGLFGAQACRVDGDPEWLAVASNLIPPRANTPPFEGALEQGLTSRFARRTP